MVDQKLIIELQNFCVSLPSELKLQDAYLFAPESKGYKFDEQNPDLALVFSHVSNFHKLEYQLKQLMITAGINYHLLILEECEMNIDNPIAWEIFHNSVEIIINRKIKR